jgi:D-alanyl-D-alanine carboxypeptidase
MRRKGLRAAITLAALALLCAAPAASGSSRAEQRLQAALEKLVEIKGGPPGVSVVLVRGNREKFVEAGVADVDTGKPFTRRKHMRIASVSKAFSGAVALSLVDQGLLSLDDTIASRLPSLPAAWGSVTLRQLLGHTGGVPSYTTDPAFQQYFGEHLHGDITLLELVDFVRDKPLEFTPGTGYHYSNTDNIIIALMAEAATGTPYVDLLRQEVERPLGLRETDLPRGFKIPKPLIRGYDTLPKIEDLTECCSMAFVSASGGIYSTPHDLTRFTRGYVGGELFGGATRSAQFSFVEGGSSEPPGPGKNSGGLALFRYETRCGTVFGHTGNFPGYTQFTAATRNGKRAVTVSVNRQLAPDAPGKKAVQVFKTLRRDYTLAVCALLK